MPGSKWPTKDALALEQMKEQLQPLLSTLPPYPEVVGDRRLLRFLKGYNFNVDKAVKAYQEFIKWRTTNDVDAIRNDILYGGKNHPTTFPHAETIMRVLPQIVLAPHATDNAGQPITLETFDFDPNHVLEEMSVEQYLVFLIYSLEFRTLVLEQMAVDRDAAYIAAHPNIEDQEDGYGYILKLCCLRDLNGVGFKHVGRKTQAIMKTVLEIAVPNYQEYLGKSYMVNVPWVFETVWVFVKNILDESTVKKIAFYGTQFLDDLLKEMPIESIPVTMGGKLPVESWSYDFDTKSGGLFCPDSNHVDLDEVHLRNEHKLELEKNMLAVAADNSTSTGMKNSSEKNVSVLSKGMKASSKLLLRLSGSEKVTSPLGYQELSTRSITEIQLENMKIIYRKNVKSFDQDAGSSNGTAKSSSEKQSTIVHIPSAFNGIISSVPNTFHSLFHFNVQHSQGNSTTTSLASSPNKQSMQASRNTNLKNVFDTEKTSNLSTNESVSEINRRTRIHHLNDKNNQYHHHHHHEFAGVLHTSCLAPKSDQNTSNSIDPKRRKSIAGHKLSSDEQSSFSKSAKDATPTKGDNSPKIRPFTTSLIGLPPLKLPGLFSDHHNSRNSNSDSSPSLQQHTDNSPTTIHNSHFPEYPPRKSISSVSAVFGFGTKTHSGTGNGSVVDVSDNQSESTMSEAMYLIPHADSDDAHSDTHSITSTSHDEVHVSGRVTRPVPHHGKIGPTGSLSSLFESVTTKPTLGSRGTSNSSGGSMNARVHYHLSESASIHEPQSLEMNPNIESSVQQSSYSEPISSHISPKQYSDQSTQTDMTIPAVGNALIVYDFQSLGTSLTVLLSMSPMVTLSAVAIAILSYYGHNFFATLILIFVSVYGIYIAISY